jgi:tRNA pseudouridine(38-40) synthase
MPPNKRRKKQKNREFDFSRYHERHVALRIAYLGMAYHGFAAQGESTERARMVWCGVVWCGVVWCGVVSRGPPALSLPACRRISPPRLDGVYCTSLHHRNAGPDDVDSTVEAVLLIALQRACLIQDRVSSRYSRCGRTDKGVSAFGQVISICLRTNLTTVTGANEVGFVEKESALDAAVQRKLIDSPKEELDFVHLANRLLPDDIRVTAWSPVADDFDARFSAASRSYKYFFLREDNDIEQMRAAAKLFIGVHDFRNFCKMDIAGGVTNFKRKIMSVTISPADSTVDTDPEYGMYCIDVCGQVSRYYFCAAR